MPTPSDGFIGREQEVRDLLTLMAQEQTRLITLVSPGGMGKTRLMLHTWQQFRQNAPDSTWLALAQNCTSREALIAEMARAGGHGFHTRASAYDQLMHFYAQKRGWMFVDNVEQLSASAAGLIDNLLNACPQLRFVVTSQTRLNLSYETVLHLKGLDCASEAVELFVYHAQRIRYDFALDASTRSDVEQICALVGGMPLAITLAAAWIDALSPREIVAVLQNDARLLHGEWHDLPERHRRIETVLGTAWEQLSDAEQGALAGLAVFRDGFTLHAAQTILDRDLSQTADLIRRLMQRSLLWRDSTGRYRIHELIRVYAEPYADSAAAERHTRYFVDLVLRQHDALRGADQDAAIQRIRDEWENIGGAWDRMLKTGDQDQILPLIDALYLYFDLNSQWFQGEAFFQSAYQRLSADHAPETILTEVALRAVHLSLLAHPSNTLSDAEIRQIDALLATEHAESAFHAYVSGHFALIRRDWQTSHDQFCASLRLYEQTPDPFYAARVLHIMGYAAIQMTDFDTAQAYTCASIDISRSTQNRAGLIASLFNLGSIAMWRGEFESAGAAFDEAMALIQRQTQVNWWRLLTARQCLSSLAFYRGDFSRSKALAEQVIAASRQHGYSYGLENGLSNLHHSLIAEEAYADALALYENEPTLPPDTRSIGLAMAYLGLGQLDRAVPLIAAGLRSDSSRTIRAALCCAAFWLAETGQDGRAIELLSASGLSIRPRSIRQPNRGVFVEHFPMFTRLYHALERRIAPHRFAKAWERGRTLDLHATAAHVRQTLERHRTPPDSDTLSSREREVLTLVAEGCTNQTIADQLVVEVDTVKKHLTHIYRKLRVANRTQALLRAQELNLI